jgi:hypothetical protein
MVFGSSRRPGLSDASLKAASYWAIIASRISAMVTRKVRNNGCCGEGETEPNQIVGGIASHGLIKVADFDFELAVGVGNGAKVADMTVPADPNLGPLGDRGRALFKPFVKLGRRASHIVQRGPRHFLVPQTLQSRTALTG